MCRAGRRPGSPASARRPSLDTWDNAVAARVIGDLLMSALQAPQDVSPQGGGAARGQVVEGTALHGRQARTVLLQKRVATAPDHLGHFEPRSCHGWVSP